MSMKYPAESVLLNEVNQVVGASATNSPISREFPISAKGSLNLLVGLKCASVTAGAGITAKIQSSILGGAEADWIDGNTASVTGNGWVYIRMNVQTTGDQAKLPLADVGRLVLTTGIGSTVTVTEAYICQGI